MSTRAKSVSALAKNKENKPGIYPLIGQGYASPWAVMGRDRKVHGCSSRSAARALWTQLRAGTIKDTKEVAAHTEQTEAASTPELAGIL